MTIDRLRAHVFTVLVASAAAAYLLWLRPRLRTWGATPDEVARDYPGDELIPDPDDWSTMAMTLPAPPESVWRWLAQMGGDRGGWYSRDWLDNNAKPSADRIVPEWQHLEVGQRMSRVAAPAQEPGSFTVVRLEPNRTLVLRSSYELPTGHEFDPRSGPAPKVWVDGVWSFHLQPADEGTRLVARSRNRGRPRWITRPFAVLLGEPMHFAMQTRQFRNLRSRVTANQSASVGAVDLVRPPALVPSRVPPDDAPRVTRRLHDALLDMVQRVGGTRVGVLTIGRVFSPLQRRLYRITAGRISLTGAAPVLLLTTTGRRSGMPRTVPLFYLRDQERLVICNVNPGFERPNPWTLNLRAQPRAQVQVGADTLAVTSREATGEELDRYWPRLTQLWPAYETFSNDGGKRSVFILEPSPAC